jgi:signal transduction histidine kinase
MEITGPLPLGIKEESLLDMHSILNVLNVGTYELMQIQSLLSEPNSIEDAIDLNSSAAATLYDPKSASNLINTIDDFIAQILGVVYEEAERNELSQSKKFKDHLKNIESIFAVMRIRALEIQARRENPLAWVKHDVQELKSNFTEVLRAIERNSLGAYRIVHNIAEHEDGNYFVVFEIDSSLGSNIYMPAIFQDVMRDIIANARKYTKPGGRIIAGLTYDAAKLHFVVSDTGMGIPADEIKEVIQFGQRGKSASERPTRGGGFGLTKAYYVTRKFGGRMWIESTGVPGEGTRVTITLPVPNQVKE